MNKQVMSEMKRIGIVLLLCLFWSEAVALAECQYSFVPSLSIVETYDDNIYLSSTDETSDLTTVILPAISFDVRCPTKGVTLSYNAPFVFYRRRTEHNTIRQGADLSAFHQVGPYTRVDFSDNFYRSEEPREPEETVYATRRTRNAYFRNHADIKASHQFGPRDRFFVGYNDNHLENKDPLVEDVRIQTPYVGLSYWLDVKNGLEFDVRHSVSDYEESPDFKQNSDTLRFTHLLSQTSSLSVAYTYMDMDYDPGGNDYVVHDAIASYSMNLLPHTALNAGIGYFVRNPERGGTSDGFSYHLAIDQKLERGSFSLGGRGGYRQEVIDAENRGFAKFWSVNGRISYLILARLTLSGALSYDEARFIEQADRRDASWSASAGLTYSYRDWLSLSLTGHHLESDSSMDVNDYDNNKVILMLTATYR